LAESTSREWSVRALSADTPLRDVGLLYAVASYEKAQTFEAKRALFTQVAREPSLIRVGSTHADAMAFVPDGKRLLSKGPDAIYAFDPATGEETRMVKFASEADPLALVIDPGGTTYSSMSTDSATNTMTVRAWEVSSGRKLGEVRMRMPSDVAYADRSAFNWQVGPPASDGHRLVAGSQGNDVVLWDLESGRERHRLRGHTQTPNAMVFSPDGSIVATSTLGTDIIVWDVRTGKRIRKLGIASFGGPAMAISYDNAALAIAETRSDSLTVWSLGTNGPPLRRPVPNSSLVAFMPNGALVGASLEGEVRVFARPLDASDTSPGLILHGAEEPRTLDASASGRRIALLSGEGLAYVWDLADGGVMQPIALPIDSMTGVTGVAPYGALVGTGSTDGFDVWDVTSTPPLRRARYDGRAFRELTALQEVRIGDSGRLVLVPAADSDRGVRYLIPGSSDSVERIIRNPGNAPIVVDPVRARVAYGLPGTRAVVVMEPASGIADTFDLGRDPSVAVDTESVPLVEFSPRGDLLLVQPSQMTFYVWDIATKQVRDSLIGIAVNSNLLASEDGSIIASMDGLMLQFWRRGEREPSSRFRWKPGTSARTLALSPNGELFAYDHEGKVTLGDVRRGDIIGEIDTGQGTAIALAFVDGGRALVAVSPDGRIARIATHPDAWVQRACGIAAAREAFVRFGVYGPGAGVAPPQRCRPATAAAATR